MTRTTANGLNNPPELGPRTEGHRGPSLEVLVWIHAALFAASLVLLNAVATEPWPLPGTSSTSIVAYLRHNQSTIRMGGALQFAASVPLALYAATMCSRLMYLKVRAAGPTIALMGGLAASIFLAAGGLIMAGAGLAADAVTPSTAAAMHSLIFLTGGPAAIVFIGLLVAGVTVPSRVCGFLPRGVTAAGVAIAVVCEAATLATGFDQAWVLLPIGRIASTVWLILAARLLPRGRPK